MVRTGAVALSLVLLLVESAAAPSTPFDAHLQWRSVGPAVAGGRVSAVAGTPQDDMLYYVGAAGGGVWKSDSGGASWSPVFDREPVGAIGAIAIDPEHENVVWVGTGEANPRNDVSYGDGLYKSTDGGATWTRVGLRAARDISRIAVDPTDPNHVVVAAFGDFFRDSSAGGIYVTFDGGQTWSHSLYVGPSSGGSDVAIAADDPSVVYAGIWQFRRTPWTFRSGGLDDGLYKSTDGGKSWARLTGHGLPAGIVGRIGLAVAPSDPNRVYALIESRAGILWRSDDGGQTWTMVNDDTLIDQRPFYFSHIEVDPQNENRVYAVSERLAQSVDGGRSFHVIAPGVHVDDHAIWIAPNDPGRVIVGDDGGYALTVNGGKVWSFEKNLPIAQAYRVGVSDENPYWVCTGLQDNSAWCGPSNSQDPTGIGNRDWIDVAGGDGEWAVPDPADPNFIVVDTAMGIYTVVNTATKDSWFVKPVLRTSAETFDAARSSVRWNWEAPIGFSPWSPRVLWAAGNVVFQSTDRGLRWKRISPDLTRNIKAHEGPPGGPIVHDIDAEDSDTILDIEGSRVRRGEIWVGTDDGLVQCTTDGGRHWKNVTPATAPRFGRVETIAPSPLIDGTAYAAIDNHRAGDDKPYIYVTHDFGKTWRVVVSGLPHDQFVRTVRPDSRNPNVIYAGTEEGIWVSFDGGGFWESLQSNLPSVSVRDIRIARGFDDLIIATHGRGIYIMDDVASLQQLSNAAAAGEYAFPIRTSYQYNERDDYDFGASAGFVGQNPPTGTIVDFYQRAPQQETPTIDFLDEHGRLLRSYHLPNDRGVNRFIWNWSVPGPLEWNGAAKHGFQADDGPWVPPGVYTARLHLGGRTISRSFVIRADPRTLYTQAQIVKAYRFALRTDALLSTVDDMLNGLDRIKKALDRATAATGGTRVSESLAAIGSDRAALFGTLTANWRNSEDFSQRPGALRESFDSLIEEQGEVVTPGLAAFQERMAADVRAAARRYNELVRRKIPVLNAELAALRLKPVAVAPEVVK